MMGLKTWQVVLVVALAGQGEILASGVPATQPTLPHADEPAVVQSIRALGDNCSLLLPPVRTAGEGLDAFEGFRRNGPGRRDYCNKMVYAPDRQTALYCGGNHGSPHRFNDAWEYHLGSNTWHLLFAPDGGNHHTSIGKPGWIRDNVVFKDGYLQTRKGGPVNPVHTWDGLTYDPEARRMLWADVVTWNDLKKFAQETSQDYEALNAQAKPGTNLWMFDPAKGRWFKQTGPGPAPKLACQGGSLVYVPELKKSLWYAACWYEQGLWAYDSAANTWTELKPSGNRNTYHDKEDLFPDAELQAAYSSRHRKLVAVRGRNTYVYDIDRNEFARVGTDEKNSAHDAHTIFAYDSVSDVFLLLDGKGQTVRGYTVADNRWQDLPVQGPAPTGGMGYFDPKHNVLVAVAGNRVWVYRYRRAGAGSK